jgi:C4-dicarboxylate-specific signal transduction histidine kinase
MLAQLHESQNRLEEHAAQLEQQARELRTLCEVGQSVNRTLHPRATLEAALDRALGVPEITAGWAFLRPGEGESEDVPVSRGLLAGTAAAEQCRDRAECVCREVIEKGAVLVLRDPNRCEVLRREVEHQHALACHVAVPLISRGEVVGVLNLAGGDSEALQGLSLEFFQGLGEETGLALDNARLIARVRSELQRREALQQQLIHSAKLAAIGTLAAGVAHELNQPLTVIRAAAQDLQTFDQLANGEAAMLLDIERQTTRMMAIIEHLRTFSRDSRSERAATNVNEVVRQAAHMVAQQLHNRGIELVLDLEAGVGEIAADPVQLEQVVLNLLTNARDAVAGQPHGLVRVTTSRAEGAAGEEAKGVVIQVSDTGPGIPPEMRSRVFEPFFTTKEAGRGTGLGLAVSHGIVRDHGGSIEVVADSGAGATFSVWLPRTHNSRIEDAVGDAGRV